MFQESECQIPILSPSPEFFSDLGVGRVEKLLSEENILKVAETGPFEVIWGDFFGNSGVILEFKITVRVKLR